jgi:hypothetical protein
MTKDEALKLALEALKKGDYALVNAICEELKQAQPEQIQPSADSNTHQPKRHELQAKGEHPAPCARYCEANAFQIVIKNLKAQLAQRKPLSDEEILTYKYMIDWTAEWSYINFARAIEAAHGIKGGA